MIDQIPDAASIYWQSTIHRSWYQELVKIQGGEGGNADLIPQGSQDKIVIPSRFRGSLLDIRLGEHWAFIAEEYGEIKYGRGLEYFIETELQGYHRDDLAHLFGHEGWKIATPAAIFDNHNHALYFWARALSLGHIQKWATLVHIDMHSDLWTNPHRIDPVKLSDLDYMAAFTNLACNVGNYILPAQEVGLIGEMIRIEGEEQLLVAQRQLSVTANGAFPTNLILNLDLDIFAPELDDISFELKRSVILGYAARAQYITIATSPFFIDQERAIEYLYKLFL